MIIKLPKPDITCPDCKSKDIRIYKTHDAFECNDCGYGHTIDIVFEEDQTFCNCDLCKQLNKDK